jgi:hypothetical protein
VRTGIRDAYTAELDLTTGKVLSPPTPVAERFVGANMAPEWSADGRYLAWVSNRGQGPNRLEADTLCIRSNATGEVREVSPKVGFLYRLRWYPDGRFLLVQAAPRSAITGGHSERRARPCASPPASIPGAADARPTKTATSCTPTSTGRREAIHARAKPAKRVMCQPARGPGPGLSGWPAPGLRGRDGRLLPTVAPAAPAKLAGRSAAQRIQTLAWTPDGRHLLFGMDRAGADASGSAITELWRISSEGGQPQKLELAMDSLRDLRMHPDGRHIAFVAGRHKGEVWVMENFLPRTKAAVSR